MTNFLTKLQKCFFLFLLVGLTSSAAQKVPCEIENKGATQIEHCPSLHYCNTEKYCVHKDIFPLTGVEVFGSFLLMFLAGLANSGGLGGGALLSPILLLIFNYSANKAIMIVYGIVFGGSLGNFLNVAFRRNPKTGKPFVDYDLSLVCMPQMVLGAMLGVLMNKILAPILILLGLIAIIIYTGRNVYRKAKSQYVSETNILSKKLNDENEKISPKKEVELAMIDRETFGRNKTPELNQDPQFQAILEEDKEIFPKSKIKLISTMLGFVILTVILRGSSEFASPLGLKYCGSGYWFFFIITLAGCGGFYFKSVEFVNNRLAIKRENNYVAETDDDFTVTEEITKKMGVLSLIAGISAGLLGLGGGMVMSPVLLKLGIGPQPFAATLGFFVVQTSFITLFQSFFSGDVTPPELFFFVGISFIGSFGVSWALNYLVKKYKRPSIILFALSLVLFLSFIVMPLFAVYKSIDKPDQMFAFHSVC